MVSSRLEGFYKKSLGERWKILEKEAKLSEPDIALLKKEGSLTLETADKMIENCVGLFSLPYGIAANFKINGREVLVPMVTEEPSVIAAASHGAKLCFEEGFTARAGPSLMRGQIQLVGVKNPETTREKILEEKATLLDLVNQRDSTLLKLGGGAKEITVRILQGNRGQMVLVEVAVDVKDAMGANAVNTMCETMAPKLEDISGGKKRVRILSNLCPERVVKAHATWKKEIVGSPVIEGVLDAYDLAVHDAFRATTHNKGIMNGVDSVLMATGNDFRAVESGAHSYAAFQKPYGPLTHWEKTGTGDLKGSIEIPIAVGIVGGVTRTHPLAQLSLKILQVKTAGALGEIAACVGLAQNFAAMRALSTEGIQKGHMALHARNVAMAAGATGKDVERVAQQMVKEGNIRGERAKELLWKQGIKKAFAGDARKNARKIQAPSPDFESTPD
ncbi:hydroxymethylglutaryl-CoA reductase, degradative [Candidatus Micrarchaeota archaeon]|nr:hydroxymethylglutaryl-CoA reductase, degradative [Candidatus Micrarchaeota archaeon]